MRRIAQSETTPEAALSGQVSVDLSAISENIKALKKRTSAPHFMAVVKGNGYGQGLVDVARTAVEALGVTAPLVMVKKVPAGTGVSYEHQAITHEPRYLGLIPLGYADGIPKGISGRSLVQIAGSHGDEIINRIAPRLPRVYESGAYECPDYQEATSDVA